MHQLMRQLKKALTTDSTASSFASKVMTFTEPTGNGVIDFGDPGEEVPCFLLLWPYATSGDNDTMDMRVIGWRRLLSTAQGRTAWLPGALGQFTCTMSAQVGVAGAPVVATERFADTIVEHATVKLDGRTVDSAAATPIFYGSTVMHSPANDLIGMIQMPLRGCEKVEILFDTTAAGTTAMNALYALL
jgi:hypothetical protein